MSTPGGTRTSNLRFRRLKAQNRNDQDDKELRQIAECVVPTMVPSPQEADLDPNLTRLNAAWATLPAPIRTAILALLDAASPTPQTATTFAPRSPVSRSCAENGQNYQPGEEDGTPK